MICQFLLQKKLLRYLIIILGKKILVISPSYKRSGLWWKKNWGNEKYAELIHLLPENFVPMLVDRQRWNW
jgi:hypothetical protein